MSTITHALSASPDTARRRPMVAEPGVRLALGHAGLVVSTLVLGAIGARVDPALVVLLLAGALAGAGLDPRWTAWLGLSAWALATGFVEHDLGSLTLAGPDLARLAVAVGAGTLVGLARRGGRGTLAG